MAPKKKQGFTEEDAKALLEKLGHFVVSSKDRFHCDLSNNLENAWATRGSERYLYTVFSHIISHLCDTIVPPQFPTNTISHTPQALFGVHQPPVGQPAKTIDKKDLYPEQIPDFARMIFTFMDYQKGQDFVRQLVDFWEIKGLNTAQRWDSALARSEALDAIESHMEQLWKQARAAFAHNKSWTHVYALLIIGPYFSQVVWKRPAGVIKPPTADISKSATRDANRLFDNYNAMIKEVKTRDVPHIEFFNAPVFDFGPVEDGRAQKVSLSKHFLHAVSLPLKERFGSCKIQSSWFDPPPEKPSPPVHESDTASPEDHADDFDPSPHAKTAIRAWQKNPPPSPLATRRKRHGLAAAIQPQPPILLPVPQPAAPDQPVVDPELEDESDEEDEQEMMVRFRKLGSTRGSVSEGEEDEEDDADDEETEGDED